MEETPENQKYSEEEALTEAERLTNIVKAGGIGKNYTGAERWLKETRQEVRPAFDEEKFKEIESILSKLYHYWDDESSEEERKSETEVLLSKLLENRKIFIDAYGYKNNLLYDIVGIAQGYIIGGEESDTEKVRNFGLELIAELTPNIVADLQKGRLDKWALGAIDVLAGSADEEKQKLGIDALVEILDVIEKGFLDESNQAKNFLSLSIGLICEKGDVKQVPKAAETVLKVIGKIKDRQNYSSEYGTLVSYLFKNQSREVWEKGFAALNSALERYNLPLDLVELWEKSGLELSDLVSLNLSRIIELESKRPDICQFLFKEFGIADFGRYPIDMLLKQHEENDSLENPYGIILFPRNDWNGAFYQDSFKFKDFFEKLRGEFSLRIFECDGKIGVARALLKLNRKYNPPDGSGHKISLAIIGGHGTKDSIQFGGIDERNSLYTKDLMGSGAQRTSEFFEKNPTIILISCSTGADKGIGQKLSEIMGAKVISPKIPTSISEIQVGKQRGGKFRFNARYFPKDGGEQDIKSVFVGGAGKDK